MVVNAAIYALVSRVLRLSSPPAASAAFTAQPDQAATKSNYQLLSTNAGAVQNTYHVEIAVFKAAGH